MNPRVDDIPERFLGDPSRCPGAVVMGTVDHGGSGCVCPESVMLKTLVTHLLLGQSDVLIMDMEGGHRAPGTGYCAGSGGCLDRGRRAGAAQHSDGAHHPAFGSGYWPEEGLYRRQQGAPMSRIAPLSPSNSLARISWAFCPIAPRRSKRTSKAERSLILTQRCLRPPRRSRRVWNRARETPIVEGSGMNERVETGVVGLDEMLRGRARAANGGAGAWRARRRQDDLGVAVPLSWRAAKG